MPIDAQIPLSGIQFRTQTPEQVMSLQNLATMSQLHGVQLQEARQTYADEQKIRQLAQNPGTVDQQTGFWTPEGLTSLANISPTYAQKAAQQRQTGLMQLSDIRQKNVQEQVNLGLLDERTNKQRISASDRVNNRYVNTYDLAKKAGASDEIAEQQANAAFGDEFSNMQNAGELTFLKPGEKEAILAQKRDITSVRSKLPRKELMAEEEKARADVRADEAGKRAEETPIIKEQRLLDELVKKGQGNSPMAKALRGHIAKMDTPPQWLAQTPAQLTEAQAKLQGEDFLKSLSPADQVTVKGIANMELDPSTISKRNNQQQRVLEMVKQYRPDYNAQDFKESQAAATRFGSGKQGDQVRAFNVALEHLDTLQQAGTALQNKDVQAINRLANFWKTQTGQTGPTDFAAVKQLVAGEVVKAIVGSGGGVTDREEAAKIIQAANSPEQLSGVIGRFQQLFGGQLHGLEQQYKAATKRGDFRDRYLTDTGRAAATKADADVSKQPAAELPMTNDKGWKLHTDGQGRKAYVSPDGKDFEIPKKQINEIGKPREMKGRPGVTIERIQ